MFTFTEICRKDCYIYVELKGIKFGSCNFTCSLKQQAILPCSKLKDRTFSVISHFVTSTKCAEYFQKMQRRFRVTEG